MSAPARLLALRLQGFKSFAERTLVEFGPGISAVVGPNGSGKSNLADALRWALGEQGRALRSRKSRGRHLRRLERRAALGMADVTLVLDNADGLLPVEYSVLELGRRLYRSGENDYLLNKQRVRLRDLVDLLDGAHLADNAFLFIGQGMVDQALALRPEERRPLFEEVAGVRRHERRRRKAEEQLAESETNLARVDDILAELRPQARRLAAQAEQQATRLTAGEELAAALIAAAHGRWHEAARRAAPRSGSRARARRGRRGRWTALRAAEEAAAAIGAVDGGARRSPSGSAAPPTRRRARRVPRWACARPGRRASWRRSLATGRGSPTSGRRPRRISRRSAGSSREPVPAPRPATRGALAEADRALAEALAELASLRPRAARGARSWPRSGARRRRGQAEAETARRRSPTRRDGSRPSRPRPTDVTARRASSRGAGGHVRRWRARPGEAAAPSPARPLASPDAAEGRDAPRPSGVAPAGSALAGITGQLEAVERRLSDDEARG